MYRRVLHAVGAAYAARSAAWSGEGWRVRRVRAGMNNALYRVEGHGRVYACKLCVPDERLRARREAAALSLLEQRGVDVAPGSVVLDDSLTRVPLPAVVYDWLPGEPPQPALTGEQQAALLEALHALHAISLDPAAGIGDAWFHWFAPEPYLAELDEFARQYLPWLRQRGDDAIAGRLERMVAECRGWVRRQAVDLSRLAIPMRLCHVDPNPANMIWGLDARLRWVDWEYSGWGDPALDLAEYRWHAGWLEAPDAQHAWLRANYCPPAEDPAFWQRVAVWDRLLAARWPFLNLRWLYSLDRSPDRLRLAVSDVRACELQARLARLVERAEETFA